MLSFLSLLLLILLNPDFRQEFSSYSERIPGTDLMLEMVPVEGGEFMMGSPESEEGRDVDEGPVHKVSVDDFWIGRYEITWELYESFVFRDKNENNFVSESELAALGIDGVSAATSPYVDMSFGMGKSGYPAINMTQYAAQVFCQWLTAKTGHFYRLPTEAEWEYACRAGNSASRFYGDDKSELEDYAVYRANSEGQYARPGGKKSNPLGIYDILGNVSEWTLDQYDENFYAVSGKDNPWNRPEELYPRVLRGGNWRYGADECRCAARMESKSRWKMRDPQIPKSRWWHTNAPFVGFRVVRPREQPPAKEIMKFWLKPMDDF